MPKEPFSYRRRVAFGECDPARIYFAPRAVDYAVEAVEAWYESVLRAPWAELLLRHGLEPSFLRAECEFLRPLLPGQVIRVALRVVETGPAHVGFLATGELSPGEACFRVRLKGCLTGRDGIGPVPIPPEYLERFAAYRARCGGDAAAGDVTGTERGGALVPAPQDGDPNVAAPFTRRHRVLYGECGPSGKLYAPKVFDFVVEAIGEWFEEVPGVSWMELVSERRQGVPWVSAACDYLRPVLPGQVITMGVRVTRLGRASVGFAVAGHEASGAPCFDSRWTACFIDQDAGFRPMPVPEEIRGRIEAYRAACGAGE